MNKFSILARNILSFFIVCLMTFVLLGSMTFYFIKTSSEERIQKEYSILAEQAENSINDIFSTLYHIPYLILENNDLSFYKIWSGNLLDLVNAAEQIDKYVAANPNVYQMFLYSAKTGKFIGPDNVYSKDKFGKSCYYLEGVAFNELLDSLDPQHVQLLPATSLYTSPTARPLRMIPVILPFPNAGYSDMFLFLFLYEDTIQKELLRGFQSSEALLIDGEGDIITSTGSYEEEFLERLILFSENEESAVLKPVGDQDKEVLATVTKSPLINMRLVFLSEKEMIYSGVYDTMWILGIVLIVMFVIFMAVGMLFSIWNYSPLRGVYSSLGIREQAPKRWFINDAELLENAFSSLTMDNDNLKSRLNISDLYVRDSVLHRLVTGQYNSIEEVLEKCREIGLDFHCGNFRVLQLSAEDHANDIPAERLAVLLAERGVEATFTLPVKNSRILGLLQYPEHVDLPKELEECYRITTEETGVPYGISMGITCGSLKDLPFSYISIMGNGQAAVRASGVLICGGETVGPEQVDEEEAKRQLSYGLLSQNVSNIRSSIDRAIEIIMREDNHSCDRYLFAAEILSILTGKFCEMEAARDPSEENKEGHVLTLPHAAEMLRVLSEETILKISEAGTTSKKIVAENILLYIGAHYLEPNFSLAEISAEFHMSESAFSHMFKKQMDCTFINYVNNLKVQHAKVLLKTTDQNLEEIAETLCYSTTSNFIRMFKNITGQTPSNYRAACK